MYLHLMMPKNNTPPKKHLMPIRINMVIFIMIAKMLLKLHKYIASLMPVIVLVHNWLKKI